MRFLKWISAMTILTLLFAMLPATVAENEIIIDLDKSVNDIANITVNTADGKGKADQIRVCVPEPTEIKIDEYWEEEDYKIVLGQTMTISADKKTPYAYVTEI